MCITAQVLYSVAGVEDTQEDTVALSPCLPTLGTRLAWRQSHLTHWYATEPLSSTAR